MEDFNVFMVISKRNKPSDTEGRFVKYCNILITDYFSFISCTTRSDELFFKYS